MSNYSGETVNKCLLASIFGMLGILFGGPCIKYNLIYPKIEQSTKATTHRVEQHDVDQVFRDHDGYRVYFDDEQGRVIEKRYFDVGNFKNLHFMDVETLPFPNLRVEGFKGLEDKTDHVRIYKDLPEKSQGYVRVLHYTMTGVVGGHYFDENFPLFYAEIHIPKNKDISAGNEAWQQGVRCKRPIIKNAPMGEIK